jgi:L-serine dehydratase
MESLRELYRIGSGPSASHTLGPRVAAERFRTRTSGATRYRVTLYGSLAATGRGHLTDQAIEQALQPALTEIIWKPDVTLAFHPNGIDFEALDAGGNVAARWRIFSIGGGALREDSGIAAVPATPSGNTTGGAGGDARGSGGSAAVCDCGTMAAILDWSQQNGEPLWMYVQVHEGADLWSHLRDVWHTMQEALSRGLSADGALPGPLRLARKASSYLRKAQRMAGPFRGSGILTAYALAVSEENASGGLVATAPTCGSCGVLPAVLRYLQEEMRCAEQDILRALACAGLFGNMAKRNASISGAEVGCQGEIGVACAMSAAAATQLLGGTPAQIEYAAEMGLEHHLGLTCDPVAGLVQIPCIERNAMAATRALDCASFALLSDGRHRISYDQVVQVMRTTGKDLPSLYRETAAGGLAAVYGQSEPSSKP